MNPHIIVLLSLSYVLLSVFYFRQELKSWFVRKYSIYVPSQSKEVSQSVEPGLVMNTAQKINLFDLNAQTTDTDTDTDEFMDIDDFNIEYANDPDRPDLEAEVSEVNATTPEQSPEEEIIDDPAVKSDDDISAAYQEVVNPSHDPSRERRAAITLRDLINTEFVDEVHNNPATASRLDRMMQQLANVQDRNY